MPSSIKPILFNLDYEYPHTAPFTPFSPELQAVELEMAPILAAHSNKVSEGEETQGYGVLEVDM